jgi:hypothetical protein
MLGQAPVQIIGDAGVQGFVSAFQHIDNPVHSTPYLYAYRTLKVGLSSGQLWRLSYMAFD